MPSATRVPSAATRLDDDRGDHRGMVPVALATSDGSEWRNPMGILVIGGLTSSTLLTLVVVPVAYTYVDDIRGILPRAFALRARLGLAAQRLRGRIHFPRRGA